MREPTPVRSAKIREKNNRLCGGSRFFPWALYIAMLQLLIAATGMSNPVKMISSPVLRLFGAAGS